MTLNFVIGLVVEAAIAVIGVVALVRAGRCTRGRFAAAAAGVALILYTLIAVPWRIWSHVVYLGSYDPASGSPDDAMLLFDTLAAVRTITGSIILTAVVVLLIGVLMVQARNDGAPGGGHYGAAYAAPPQHPHNRAAWGQPPNWPGEHPSAPGQWSPASGLQQSEQSPPHDTRPPGGEAR